MKKEYILLCIMVLIWSLTFIIVDNLTVFLTPITIALYRFIVASVAFAAITPFEKLIRKNNPPMNDSQINLVNKYELKTKIYSRKRDFLKILICSFIGGSLFFYIQYTSIELIGPTTSALIVCLLSPIFIAILSLIFFNEKLNFMKIGGFVLASIGTIILISRGDLSNIDFFSQNFIGILFGLSMPILWAIYITLLKDLSKRYKTSQIMRYIIYLGTLELFIFVILMGEMDIFIENFFNFYVFINIVYISILAYAFGQFIWAYSLKKLESSKVASFLYAEPFLTLLFSFILGIEQEILVPLIGGILILIAVIIITQT